MRLISQKNIGYIDIEYEKSTILLKKEGCWIILVHTEDDRHIAMAAYDSEDKARKVLDDMQKLYGTYIKCEGGAGIMVGSGYQQAFCFEPPKTFEFPENDKVEV